MSKTKSAVTTAIDRLRHEEQIALVDLSWERFTMPDGRRVRLRPDVLKRWGMHGKDGVFLDILRCKTRLQWVTSRAAITRFLIELTMSELGLNTPKTHDPAIQTPTDHS